MQLSIFSGYFPYGLEESAKKIRSHGFNTVQLDPHFKDIDLSHGNLTAANCKKVRDTFRAHDLPISCILGYTNIIHPDMAHRKANVDRLKDSIRNARALGTPYVISETGTYNTEEGFEACRKIIAELAQEAYDHGAMVLLETYVNNVGSVEETV
jgi:sugar phosphate isomerase/epimerase